MRRINKLMAVLLSLTMCLSLLPVTAFAENPEDDSDSKVQTGMNKEDHQPYEPTESYTDPFTGVTDIIMDKVDEEATKTEASDALNEKLEGEEGVEAKADAADTEADRVVSKSDEDFNTLKQNVENAVKVGDYEGTAGTEPAGDEEGNAVPNAPDETVPDPEVTTDETGTPVVNVPDLDEDAPKATPIDEYVGKVETKEDGTTEATGKVGEVAQAAADAAGAAQAAQKALENATSIAAGTKAPGAEATQAQEDLRDAQQAAFDAYQEANTAAIKAAQSYAEAEVAVTKAQEQLNALTGAYETYSAGVQSQIDEAQKLVKAAQDALDAAATEKAEAEKQRDYASLYNTLAQAITGEYTVSEEELKKPDEVKKPEEPTVTKPEEPAEDASDEVKQQYQEELEAYLKAQNEYKEAQEKYEQYEYDLILYNAALAKDALAKETEAFNPEPPVPPAEPEWVRNPGEFTQVEPTKPSGLEAINPVAWARYNEAKKCESRVE